MFQQPHAAKQGGVTIAQAGMMKEGVSGVTIAFLDCSGPRGGWREKRLVS